MNPERFLRWVHRVQGERLTGDTDEIERGVTDKLRFPAGVEDFFQQLIGEQKIDSAGGVRIR